MIKIEGLHKSYKNGKNSLHVLKGIDMQIDQGEFVSIMGSSGSGKSTLLNILGILDDYCEGNYYLNDTKIMNLTENKAAVLRNKFIGFVFQQFNLIPYKNAIENVALPLFYQGVSRKKRNILAQEYLEKVGLGDRGYHLPSEMSGGQKQRVAIARSIITNPKVIFADEPTGALDSVTSAEVMELFKKINQQGITMVIVTHENEVAEKTNKVYHIKDGIIDKIIKQ